MEEVILSILQIDNVAFREPSRCSCGRKGLFKLYSKEMVDVQEIELLDTRKDNFPQGKTKVLSSICVELTEELADSSLIKEGNKVKIYGLVKTEPMRERGKITNNVKFILRANNVLPI